MNLIKCEKLEKSMAELQLSIDAEAFKKAVADVFKKEGKKYAVPGFRKGKAPRSLIEKMYGADVFTYDAINELFPEAFEAAVKEANVEPVGRHRSDRRLENLSGRYSIGIGIAHIEQNNITQSEIGRRRISRQNKFDFGNIFRRTISNQPQS